MGKKERGKRANTGTCRRGEVLEGDKIFPNKEQTANTRKVKMGE